MSPRPPDEAPRREQVRAVFERDDFYFQSDFHIDFRAAAVRELTGVVDQGSILDVGCGDGRISLQYLAPAVRVTLVDLSSRMLKLAAARVPESLAANVGFELGALEDLPGGRSFDLVLCIGVLAHVPELEDFVARLASFVAPGGRLIVQITDFEQPVAKVLDVISRARRRIADPRGYTTNRTPGSVVIAMAARAGLRFVRDRPHWQLLPGMSLLPLAWRMAFMRLGFDHARFAALGGDKLLLFSRP